jgi:hypothetical protein
MNKSIATIEAPEFINLQPLDINPLMSSCEIKVLYIGENRNRTYISKETATEMAKTLRGAPIVGYYKEDKGDFADHGQRVTMDDDGIKFECLTVPYGFVAPDAQVWFKTFEDTDEFGNVETREYLMTTGYLWTGQFPECGLAVTEEGRPHSMELDENSLEGHWATNNKTNMEFFIINDAIFSKLCILGEDVEPCFEGSSLSAPKISAAYTKVDGDFKQTLFSMMQDLKNALQGGQQMEVGAEEIVEVTEPVVEPVAEEIIETPAPEEVTETPIEEVVVEVTEPVVEEEVVEPAAEETPEEVVETVETTDETPVEPATPIVEEEVAVVEETAPVVEEVNSDDNIGEKYALLEKDFSELKTSYTTLQEEVLSLRQFKLEVENAEKDKMINSFYMLSEEDKKEVIENKAQFTLEEIESKLSVICVRKKVNFSLEEEKTETNTSNLIYSLDYEEGSAPAWITAVKNNQKR